MRKHVLSWVLILAMVIALVGAVPAGASDSDFTIQGGVLTAYNGPGGNVVIPKGVTAIGDRAFYDCYALTGVTIPEGVTRIGDSAFYDCRKMASVTIPDSVTSIGEMAFWDCDRLTSVKIPDGVTIISDNLFGGCDALTSVTIPDSVTIIDDSAFECCSSLTSVTIPDSVTSIGHLAFQRCEALKSVTIPDSVTSIGAWAFRECKALESVTIPDSVTSIDSWAFEDCPSLTSVTIPDSVTSIGECTFGYYWDGDVGDDLRQPGFTIIGSAGSAAETYAIENDIPFIAQDSPAATFTDIKPGAFYQDSVAWAVAAGVTNGTSPTTFGPDDNCTRGQIVTFLWRAKGSPEPETTDCPFVDVSPKGFYYKAMLWAVENGITKGLDATHFGPEEPCNRAQAVTFLWRAEGSPAPGSEANPFTDATSGFYMKAMLWAVEMGITKGTSATTFGPDDTCSRGHIVTFLYRDLVK